jgi:hypothetical protein
MGCLPLNDRSVMFTPSKLRTLVQALRAKGHPSLVEPLSVDPSSKAPSPHSEPSAPSGGTVNSLEAPGLAHGLFPHADVPISGRS